MSNFAKKIFRDRDPKAAAWGSIGVVREQKASPRYVDDLITVWPSRRAALLAGFHRARSIRWQRIREFRLRGHGCAIAIHEDTHLSISRLGSSLSFSLFVPVIFRASLNLRIVRSRERKSDIAVVYLSSDLKLDSANNNGILLQSHVGEYNTFCR